MPIVSFRLHHSITCTTSRSRLDAWSHALLSIFPRFHKDLHRVINKFSNESFASRFAPPHRGTPLQQVTATSGQIVSVEADQDDYTHLHNERSEHGHRHLRKNPPGPKGAHIIAPHKGDGPPLRELICHWDEDEQGWAVKKIPVPALKGHIGHGDCICDLDCPCIPTTPGSSDMMCIGW